MNNKSYLNANMRNHYQVRAAISGTFIRFDFSEIKRPEYLKLWNFRTFSLSYNFVVSLSTTAVTMAVATFLSMFRTICFNHSEKQLNRLNLLRFSLPIHCIQANDGDFYEN